MTKKDNMISKNMNRIFLIIGMVIAGAFAVSCDNDDDYNVVLPVYQDVIFTQGGTQVSSRAIMADQPVTVTLVQAKKGKGIYRYNYIWSSDAELQNFQTGQISSNYDTDPTNSFTATTPGNYTMTIKVRYDYSGNKAPVAPSVEIANGTVTYNAAGALYGEATITKEFTIR